MWLKKLVAITMIVTLAGMNVLVLVGLFLPNSSATKVGISVTNRLTESAPTVQLSVEPATIPAGSVATISWSTTGNPTSCEATGGWSGSKTIEGNESTGRKTQQTTYTYTLTCRNSGGEATASAILTVSAPDSTPSNSQVATTKPTPAAPQVTYCGGRSPCYGPKDMAARVAKGNCYGWNGELVFNVTSLDEQYHKPLTQIDSVETSTICGKDLGPALRGQIGVPGADAHAHKSSTINNTQANLLQFFVGYYDAKKP